MKKNKNIIKITERQLKSVIEKIISEQVEPSQEEPDVIYYGVDEKLQAVINKLNKTVTMKRYSVYNDATSDQPTFEITVSNFWPKPYKNTTLTNFLMGWAHIDVINKKGKQKDAVMLLQYDCGSPQKGFYLNATDSTSYRYMQSFNLPDNNFFSQELSNSLQQNYCKYVPEKDLLKRS